MTSRRLMTIGIVALLAMVVAVAGFFIAVEAFSRRLGAGRDAAVAAATQTATTQAHDYASALKAEPSTPSDARLVQLAGQHDVRLLQTHHGEPLRLVVRSTAQYSTGAAGNNLVNLCFTVSVAAVGTASTQADVTALPKCPTS
jgi:hypothetical protein